MAKITWTITANATDITNKVLSFDMYVGRTKYLDDYSGGSFTFTINNASNYAANITYQMPIIVTASPGSVFMVFWVQQVEFSDYPGNTGLNTATIRAVDAMGLFGRAQVTSAALTQTDTGAQAAQVEAAADTVAFVDYTTGGSTASAATYTGTVLNRLNLLNATERGLFWTYQSGVIFYVRSTNWTTATAYTIGRTASSSQIGYQEFRRIQNGVTFINNVSISPDGLATQTAVNSTSVATYGTAFYSSSTVDATTTQAAGNASWVANTFSDPSSLRFELTFTDRANETAALTEFLKMFGANILRPVNVAYQVPGGSLTSQAMLPEGVRFSVDPSQTVVDVSLSPLTYYQFFTLDSATLGILDTSRLGW